MDITLYSHVDGDGCIEYERGTILVTNELDVSAAKVVIGTAGLRSLGKKLVALADLLEGCAQ